MSNVTTAMLLHSSSEPSELSQWLRHDDRENKHCQTHIIVMYINNHSY